MEASADANLSRLYERELGARDLAVKRNFEAFRSTVADIAVARDVVKSSRVAPGALVS